MKEINKILFITLSNIGDVILTLPALDYLINSFPSARITVMTSERAKDIFLSSPFIDKVVIYDKRMGFRNNIRLFNQLNKERFDIVIDLRNSFFGAFLSVRVKTSPFLAVPKNIRHMRDRHLYKVKSLKLKVKSEESSAIRKNFINISPQSKCFLPREILLLQGDA